MEICGRISYASQDPWIFPATIRENILFGNEYDKLRYTEVVRVCELEIDFFNFEDGDQTILNDRGQNLSKGQQARINLARTIYREADVYLLDEPLISLDALVQNSIFSQCILSFLKNKIVILVSQNISHIQRADSVIFLDKCTLVSQEVVMNNTNIQKTYENETKEISEEKYPEVEVLIKHNGTVEEYNKLLDHKSQSSPNIYKEVKKKGVVKWNIYKKFFQYGGGFFIFGVILVLYVLAEFCTSYGKKLLTDWSVLIDKFLKITI